MRITKVYTKTGDKGKTLLATGKKVSKSDVRIEAYGTIDELNSHVGLLRDELVSLPKNDEFDAIIANLKLIQNQLFDIGGELATPPEILDTSKQRVIKNEDVLSLEKLIDDANEHLEPLRNFVLPGGSKGNSQAHIARCVCRRAERRIVELSNSDSVRPEVITYINRLSDWFFVLSRLVNKLLNEPEILWE